MLRMEIFAIRVVAKREREKKKKHFNLIIGIMRLRLAKW